MNEQSSSGTSYIGMDWGGTKIAAAVFDVQSGTLSGHTVVATEAAAGPDAVVRRLADVAGAVCRAAGIPQQAVAGVGIGVPGVTDFERGQTLFLPNLPGDWHERPVAAQVSEMCRLPTWLVNDARAFVLAEATRGAGRHARNVVGITLGTGIGGGIVINGQLYLGMDGTAGELGHQTLDPQGPPCGCGNRGCMEAYASGPAIAALGVKAVMQGLTTRIGPLVNYDLNRITPESIMRAAEEGDAIAREILDRAGRALGTGIANIATILSPECVVIGGGVAQLGEWLLAPIRETVRQRCRAVPAERVRIVRASLGNDAGIIGAALWASQQTRPPEAE